MPNLFKPNHPDAKVVSRVKELVAKKFGLSETTTLAVAELRCYEPGCAPIETVFTARHIDGSVSDWRIAKPIKEITVDDIKILKKN